MEIIATHLASDFDSFAGIVAAKKIFKEAEIVLPSFLNQNVREFMILYEDDLPQFKEISEIDLNKVKKIILIDTRIAARLGNISKVINNPNLEIIAIDHHQKSKKDLKADKNYYKKVGSTTTIIVNEIIKKKIKITQFESALFLLGIYENTGNFSYPNTSYLDFEVSSFLMKNGANLFAVSRFLNLPLSKEQHDLLEKLILNSWIIRINEKDILFSREVMDNYVEGLSVLARKLALVEESDIVFCWVKMKDEIYLVGRSNDKDVDVSKIILLFGGGGHQFASSAVIRNIPFEKIAEIIISSLKKNIKQPIVSKNIMSFPVRVINENETIINAGDLLKKYGHSGIPIVNKKGILISIHKQ
jgi:tRNA nucleotidyltransferase (CCA-adding enzyme)